MRLLYTYTTLTPQIKETTVMLYLYHAAAAAAAAFFYGSLS